MILQMKTLPFYIITKWPITNLTDFPLNCAQLSPNTKSLVRLVLHRKTSETNSQIQIRGLLIPTGNSMASRSASQGHKSSVTAGE
jgi:hypothetical protein